MNPHNEWYNREVHEALLAAARTEEGFVSYSDIIRMGRLHEQGYAGDGLSGALGWVLYAVVMQDLGEDPNRPMLSAVALPTNGSRPGSGFFGLARELGRLESSAEHDEDVFWLQELNALRSYWRGR